MSSSESAGVAEEQEWAPPGKIEELFSATAGSEWASINAPTAGARDLKAPVPTPECTKALRLYNLGTPNGRKPLIVLEELGLQYDHFFINIGKGDQFNKYFTDINPNSKIPALEDTEGPGEASINVFESANIGLYLCEKHGGRFWFGHLPESDKTRLRVEGMNWIFFQMANQGPLTGQFGHYFVYAPAKGNDNARTYGTARYGMEVLRICDVMEKHLAASGGLSWFVGGEYSLVDMVLYPWFKQLRTGYPRGDGLTAGAFLGVEEKFPQLVRWANAIADRDAVKRAYAPAYNNLPEEFKKWA